MSESIRWQRASSDRWFAYNEDFIQVAGIFHDSEGFMRCWAWPVDKADRVWLDDCITVQRAKEEAEASLRR